VRDVLLKIGFRKGKCDFSAFTRLDEICDGYSVKSQLEAVQPHKSGADVMQKYSQRYCQMGENATQDAGENFPASRATTSVMWTRKGLRPPRS